MFRQKPLTTAAGALVTVCVLLGACSDQPATPLAPAPEFASASANGAMVFEFEYGAPFGIILTDADHQLAFYYRWDNGFCGGTAATEFVQTTSRNIRQLDERWRQFETTEGAWFYVYPWNGVANINCAYLRNTAPLASGRGTRFTRDNDFYPFDPYQPGPGANAYADLFSGLLTTPSGAPAHFTGQVHITVAADGQTVLQYNADLRLAPDPRN